MSEKNIGDITVVSVKEKKKSVSISFSNGEKVSLSPDAYVEFLLYVGKKIEPEEMKKILKYAEEDDYYVYALRLLSKDMYTSYVLRGKLIGKGAEPIVAKRVVARLINDGLINDEEYARIYVEDIAEFRLYGKNKTIARLKEKGIGEEVLSKFDFPDEEEEERATRCCLALNKKYAKYPYEKKKERAYEYLLGRGYDHTLAKKVIEECIEETPEELERELLEKDFYLARHKYYKIDDLYKRKQKILAHLLRKGYHYDDINELIQEEFK
ncbi:MAG: RecX family transcriptional regulator [Bacilli bacterium]|nr:RecX family transcriptional regulator [Bacilli bacterium]